MLMSKFSYLGERKFGSCSGLGAKMRAQVISRERTRASSYRVRFAVKRSKADLIGTVALRDLKKERHCVSSLIKIDGLYVR